MTLAIIAAMTDERVIGREGALPWRLSEDLKRFKRLTLGHAVIMGRKTWDSLPPALRPLPGRDNAVLSRAPGYRAEGARVFSSLGMAAEALAPGHSLAFVIGGAELFGEALPLAGALHLTLIHHPFPGDVFFPPFDAAAFSETGREPGLSPEGWGYEFVDMARR